MHTALAVDDVQNSELIKSFLGPLPEEFALLRAALCGDHETVQLLLEANAAVDQPTEVCTVQSSAFHASRCHASRCQLPFSLTVSGVFALCRTATPRL